MTKQKSVAQPHPSTVRVTMTGPFERDGITIPKRTAAGQPVTVELNRDLASKVINSQRGQMAAPGTKANYQLEADPNANISIHQDVSAADTKGGAKPGKA